MKSHSFYVSLLVSLVIFAFPAALSAAGSVVISEIMYDLAGSDTNREWVEIYNAGDEAVTIVDGSGDASWRFNDGSNHVLQLVQGSLTLAPGGVAVLIATSTGFLADHPGFSGTLIDTSMSLNNTSDTLKLSADKGATFFGEVTYQNTWGGNGDGKSLEKINLVGGNDASNWRSSAAEGGTPGSVSVSNSSPASTPTSSSGSGVTPAPPLPALKAEAGADVMIEAGKPLAFNGLISAGAASYKWYLGDGAVKDGAEITHTYQFPGTYLVTLEVANGGETETDQAYVFVFGRKVRINEFFPGATSTTSNPSGAASNAPDAPLSGADGWLELYNPNGSSVDLGGWILESGSQEFIVPKFVAVPPLGFLVLAQSATGLDFNKASRIELKYPNGITVDSVHYEKVASQSSASRSGESFTWSKEMTPGFANIIAAAMFGSFSGSPAPVSQVAAAPARKLVNAVGSSYSLVAETPPAEENVPNFYQEKDLAAAVQIGFWQKLAGELIFGAALAAILGLIIGLLYVKLSHKANANHFKGH